MAVGDQAIAAYNSTYGDLWVGLGDEEGELAGRRLLLADAENVTGGPSGPRFGVSAAGADTGRFSVQWRATAPSTSCIKTSTSARWSTLGRSAAQAARGQVCTAIGRW